MILMIRNVEQDTSGGNFAKEKIFNEKFQVINNFIFS